MSAGYDDLRLIGDELHFDGELVAILTDNASPSHRGRFTDLVEHGEEKDEDDTAKVADGKPTDYDTALDDLARCAKEYAKGGLLRIADLATIITRLKKESE